jgi:hypothetical protein
VGAAIQAPRGTPTADVVVTMTRMAVLVPAGSSPLSSSLAGSYGIDGCWRGPLRFLELPVILVGPMLGRMCYCRVRRRSR